MNKKEGNNMIILNTKEILSCNETEYEKHSEENNMLIDIVLELPNYDCAVFYDYLDSVNSHKEQKISYCCLHEFLDKVEITDMKNGCDFCIDDDNVFSVISYGQYFKNNGIHEVTKTKIAFVPYNNTQKNIDISKYIISRLKEISFAQTLN